MVTIDTRVLVVVAPDRLGSLRTLLRTLLPALLVVVARRTPTCCSCWSRTRS